MGVGVGEEVYCFGFSSCFSWKSSCVILGFFGLQFFIRYTVISPPPPTPRPGPSSEGPLTSLLTQASQINIKWTHSIYLISIFLPKWDTLPPFSPTQILEAHHHALNFDSCSYLILYIQKRNESVNSFFERPYSQPSSVSPSLPWAKLSSAHAETTLLLLAPREPLALPASSSRSSAGSAAHTPCEMQPFLGVSRDSPFSLTTSRNYFCFHTTSQIPGLLTHSYL